MPPVWSLFPASSASHHALARRSRIDPVRRWESASCFRSSSSCLLLRSLCVLRRQNFHSLFPSLLVPTHPLSSGKPSVSSATLFFSSFSTGAKKISLASQISAFRHRPCITTKIAPGISARQISNHPRFRLSASRLGLLRRCSHGA